MTPRDATGLAHRALTAAVLLGLRKAGRGTRVVVAELGAEAAASAELLVVTDEARVAAADVPPLLARMRAALGDDGVLALMVASPATRGLAAAASEDVIAATKERDDAYAQAIAWASNRREGGLAPALDPARLSAFVLAAEAAGLTLIEPELSATSPALSRVRGVRSARARALVATVALGATARPLLFVPTRAAPRGGLARVKVDRVADTWVESRARGHTRATPTDVVSAALRVLGEGEAGAPMTFKELLREARARWAAHAREVGGRATASAGDARELAAAVYALGEAEEIAVFAEDPGAPGWELTAM